MNFYPGKQSEIDRRLWRDVVAGDKSAFETIVNRHQSSVVAVAFSVCGDFAGSQDIAQETFWAAWSSRDKLQDTKRLAGWLRGISKNLARNWYRSNGRKRSMEPMGQGLNEPTSTRLDPADRMISEEERSAVWSSIEKLADNYRNVLQLYYDEGQSIEDVAQQLGITNATARQRLSRGRDMLRTHVAKNIDGVIDRTDPSRTFTSRVMAGITGAGIAVTAQTASAATTTGKLAATSLAAATKTLTPGMIGAAGGALGGLLGACGGILGAFIGIKLPSDLAPTETERQLLWHRGKPLLVASLLFMIFTIGISLTPLLGSIWPLAIGLPVSMLLFQGYLLLNVLKTWRLVKILRSEITPEEDPNQSMLAQKYGWGTKGDVHQASLKGRSYESPWKLLGIPLVSIQTSDVSNGYNGKGKWKVARGWIAAGDVAHGFLFGIGHIAIAPIALGGFSLGIISLGGLAMGGLAIGGGAVGILGIGGIGIGYDAVGGMAIAWHSACGGGAIAYEMAYGGGAFAKYFAVGGGVSAFEANTPLANQMIDKHSYKWVLEKVPNVWKNLFLALVILVAIAFRFFCYESTKAEDNDKTKNEKLETS